MKYFLFFFISTISFAQSNTEVYLYNLSFENDNYIVKSGKNISNNPGYDSQPHFYSKKSIIFASTRGKHTDIAKYNLESGKIKYLSDTPKGGEYSPQRIPKSKNVSAVRLDDDGLQRFYKYDSKSGKSKELIADLKVAYPFWLKKNVAINVVIVDKNLDLIISNLKKQNQFYHSKESG